jgi:hypothetical protein
MTDYSDTSDAKLAQGIVEATGLDEATALRAIESTDPTLGRAWAIAVLKSRDEQDDRMADLTQKRRRIRTYA